MNTPLWIGFVPFLLTALVLLFGKRGLVAAGVVFLFSTIVLATVIWQVMPWVMVGSVLRGFLTSFEIALIVLGSLLFLDVMRKVRVISSLEHYLHRIAPDSRIQALLLAWLFGALIEGLAGFGTPAAVVAPLLVHLGFRPLSAATIALLANTVPVAFGAVGTPIRIGMQGLPTEEVVRVIGSWGAVLSFGIVLLLTYLINREVPKRQGIIGPHGFSHAVGDDHVATRGSIVPFALWAGAVFAIPYFISSRYSNDLPTIIAAVVGLILTFFASHAPWWRRTFLPNITQRLTTFDPNMKPLTLVHTVLPYYIVVILLLVGKLLAPSVQLYLPGGIGYKLSLFQPGFIFIVVALAYALHGRLRGIELIHVGRTIGERMVRAALVIASFVAAIQVMVHSNVNLSGYPAMLEGVVTLLKKENFILFSPLIGALGGFLAGSTTVSNIMFSSIQWEAALSADIAVTLALCLQILGATAGNAMALSNISTIEVAVSLKHQERQIITKLAPLLLIYLGFIILVAVVAVTLQH